MDELASATSPHSASIPDESDVAFAAEAAAQSLEEADAATAKCQQQQLASAKTREPSEHVCKICGRGNEEGRPIIRFLPVHSDPTVASIAPNVLTLTEDFSLHVFCGKTAKILPSINQPELEILSKAGLKNKHGIGADVNAALSRTRCATLGAEGKDFYLVREFEAHLAVVRNVPFGAYDLHPQPVMAQRQQYSQDLQFRIDPHPTSPASILLPATTSSSSSSSLEYKVNPARAAAGQIHKHAAPLTSDGKNRCGCGGYHLPPGTPRGAASFRRHNATKKHLNWLRENGLI